MRLVKVFFTLLIILVIMVLTISCSDKNEGIKIDKAEAVQAGNLQDKGIRLDLSKGAFDEAVELSIESVSGEERKKYITKEFELFDTAVSIKVKDKEFVRLNEPAIITIAIPEKQLKTIESIDDVYAAYYNPKQGGWEYFIPETVDLDEGIVQFNTYHFSGYGAGKLSKEKQIDRFAKQMAVDSWAKNKTAETFSKETSQYFYELIEKQGITDQEVKGKILRNIVKSNDFADLLIKIEKGDLTSINTKIASMTGKAIIDQVKLDPGIMGQLATATETGAKVAGNLAEGDYTQAMKEISLTLMDQHILGKILKSGIEVTDQAIKDWKEKSIENAYQAYKNGANGEHGYDVDAKDFNSLSNQMKGIAHKIYSDAIKSYCLKRGIKDPDSLDQETLDFIRREADRKLEASFNERIAEEEKIEGQKSYHKKIIDAFDRNLLLDKGSFGYNVEMSLERRIERLHIVMEQILAQTGMKLNTQLVDSTDKELSLDDLSILIGIWYNDRTEGKEKYFEKLKEMGIIEEPKPEENAEKYVWCLKGMKHFDASEKVKNYNEKLKDHFSLDVNYSPGVFTIKRTYTGKTKDMSPYADAVHGESIALKADWGEPPEVILPGEKLTLTLELSCVENNQSYYDLGAWAGAKLNNAKLQNATGGSVTIGSKNNYETVKEEFWITPPAGSEVGDTLELSVFLSSTVGIQTTYIYEWEKIE